MKYHPPNESPEAKDAYRTALAMCIAVERGDGDGAAELLRQAPNREMVIAALCRFPGSILRGSARRREDVDVEGILGGILRGEYFLGEDG